MGNHRLLFFLIPASLGSLCVCVFGFFFSPSCLSVQSHSHKMQCNNDYNMVINRANLLIIRRVTRLKLFKI